MRYLEHQPAAPLRPFVRCYWTLDAASGELGDEPERVLPDGCIEVVFNAGDAFERLSDRRVPERQPLALVVGPTTRHLLIRPTGSVRLVGLRFRHAGATPFIGPVAHQLRDRTPELQDLEPRIDFRLIERRLADAGVPMSAVRVLDRELLVALTRWSGDLRREQWVVQQLLASRGAISVGTLADGANIGRRHLERMFNDSVGLTPRTLARVARFQHAVRAIERRPSRGERLAALATDCGYFDQAHFTREFHAFAGVTPAAYAARRHALSELFVLGPSAPKAPLPPSRGS